MGSLYASGWPRCETRRRRRRRLSRPCTTEQPFACPKQRYARIEALTSRSPLVYSGVHSTASLISKNSILFCSSAPWYPPIATMHGVHRRTMSHPTPLPSDKKEKKGSFPPQKASQGAHDPSFLCNPATCSNLIRLLPMGHVYFFFLPLHVLCHRSSSLEQYSHSYAPSNDPQAV